MRLVLSNPNTEEKRRRKDREFLARVRSAGAAELRQMRLDHRHGQLWKREAVERALARLGERRITIHVRRDGDDFG